MTYATQSDLENVFGAANILRWSNLTPSVSTTDTARVAAAIAYAEGVIDDRARRGRYATPLQGSGGSLPAVVTDWAAKLAACWLYESRNMKRSGTSNSDNAEVTPSHHKTAVMQEMSIYFTGARTLNCVLSHSEHVDAPEVL